MPHEGDAVKLRQGRKVGRTLYIQAGDEPSDKDILIGIVDTPWWAKHIVECVNAAHDQEPL